MDWSGFFESPLVNEGVVSGLSALQIVQEETPYRRNTGSYFSRVKSAVESFPDEHGEAVLAAFSKVFFVSLPMVEASYRYFWMCVRRQAQGDYGLALSSLQNIHLFEVDPSGLTNDFVLTNGLSRRLNHTVLSRVQNVDGIRSLLEDLLDEENPRSQDARDQIRGLASKPVWIILTDKALSGQSFTKDVHRIILLRKALELNGAVPPIYVCAQIITQDAIDYFERASSAEGWTDVHIVSALHLDSRAKVNSDDCELFGSSNVTQAVKDACVWFEENIFRYDTSFDAIREQSGSPMIYGYRECGLLFSDYRNCPSNSLPFLWYDTRDEDATFSRAVPSYVGPFPRLHSRRGPEQKRQASTTWEKLAQDEHMLRVTKLLKE